jgi:hypothetical protein
MKGVIQEAQRDGFEDAVFLAGKDRYEVIQEMLVHRILPNLICAVWIGYDKNKRICGKESGSTASLRYV